MPAAARACRKKIISIQYININIRIPYLVSIQTLKQIHNLLEEVTDFFLGCVPLVAVRVNGVDASTMLAPLVRPERLIVSVNINPVIIHVFEQIILALRLQDIGDIGVRASRIAARLVCAVTVIGPDYVNVTSCMMHGIQPTTDRG